jgi:hypothetical protein
MYKVGEEGIIVAVQVGAVKIYVAAVEALRTKKKDRVKLRKPSVSTPP